TGGARLCLARGTRLPAHLLHGTRGFAQGRFRVAGLVDLELDAPFGHGGSPEEKHSTTEGRRGRTQPRITRITRTRKRGQRSDIRRPLNSYPSYPSYPCNPCN